MQRYTLRITNWHPHRLNELLGSWKRCMRLKREDRQIVATYAKLADVPKATVKRRVSVTICLGPKQRGGDPDSYHKSLLDALKQAELIVDDNRQWVELAPVQYSRGSHRETTIVLEDVEGQAPAKAA